MKKKGLKITNDHGWTIERLQEYERTMKHANMAKRITAIRLIMQGHFGVQVAQFLNLHRETISIYVQKFNQGGMEELLKREYPPGRKPYLSNEEENELKEMIMNSTPADEGYGMETSWNSRIIQQVLEDRFSVTMSRGGIQEMLHRLGFRYKRPTYTLKRANPTQQKQFQHQIEWIKKLLQRMCVHL
jgi:transposase